MNKCHELRILCILLMVVLNVFCNDVSTKVSSGDFFRSIWQNSKQRRSVKSVSVRTDGQFRMAQPAQTAKPPFECGDRLLTLFLSPVDVGNIRIYGPLGDPLYLGQLAAFCGVSIKTTQTDVRLQFTYDSCYVKQEVAKYVVFLSWYDTDMTLSCPVIVAPPTAICKRNAMELTVVGEGTADELSVALNGEWAPLLYVATQCWHKEPSSQGRLTFKVPYTSCGINLRDGNFILDVRSKDKMMSLFCPYEPIPVSPVWSTMLPTTAQPQKQLVVFQKPPTFLPAAPGSETVKTEQGLRQQERLAVKPSQTPSLQSSHRMPNKSPLSSLLPGSFNLAVNFPFSVPLPKWQAAMPHKPHHSKPAFLTPDPTPGPILDPTPFITDPTPFIPDPTPSFIPDPSPSPSPDPTPAPTASDSKVPNPQLYPNMQFPYQFQKPDSSLSHIKPYSQEYQRVGALVPGAAQYQQLVPAQSANLPAAYQHKVNEALSTLKRYLPPGYYLCSYDRQKPEVLPQNQQIPILQPARPFQYPEYGYEKTDIAPAAPLIKQYSEPQFASPVVDTEESRPVLQPLQPQQYYAASRYIPISPQSQARPYHHHGFQDAKPYQPQYYQTPDLSRGVGMQAAGSYDSSRSPYRHSHHSKFPYPQLKSEASAGDVSSGQTVYTWPETVFQPRSLGSSNLQEPGLPGSGPSESASPQVAQLPYHQGPSPLQVRSFVSKEGSLQPRRASLLRSHFYRPPAAATRK
ncbi:uncharacterized protein [Misgurnus anguillicaudatus]|uniref:uncharacterized protein n=1 Tax=Misgurnus anguillicaudatus TaxID=75329 RepID=UPI003CCF7792